MKFLHVRALIVLTVLGCVSAEARVVINEIFYHPPNDADELQYVELYNASEEVVDLAGWKLTKGVKFQFPPGSRIEPRGYVVVGRNRDRLKETFGVEVAGTFEQPLKHSSSRIELVNAHGERIDTVKYSNRAPWPSSADGYSASLERISPAAPGDLAQNWAASPLPAKGRKPSGTPGKQNSRSSDNLPPLISGVTLRPSNQVEKPRDQETGKSQTGRGGKKLDPGFVSSAVPPDQPMRVEAQVQDSDGLREVKVAYRLAGPGFEKPVETIAMTTISPGRYQAEIPGQKAGQLVRFRIEAEDGKGMRRSFPDAEELRPWLTTFVFEPGEKAQIPTALIIHVDEADFKAAEGQRRGQSGGRQVDEEEQMRWMVWQQFQNGADLPSAWLELVVKGRLDLAAVHKLQPIFTSKKAELNKLIEQTAQSSQIREKLAEVPKLIGGFHSELSKALKAVLTPGQLQQFSAWQDQQIPKAPNAGMRWTPERMLKQMLRLESSFFAATLQSDLTAAQLEKLKDMVEKAIEARGRFVERVNDAAHGKGDWGKLQEDLAELDQKVTRDATAIFTREQQAEVTKRAEEGFGFMPGRGNSQASEDARGRNAFVYIDPKTSAVRLFDFITSTSRNAGCKVHFHRDQGLNGMTGINLIFEYKDRFVLAEHLAYELYHRVGCPAPYSEHVRLIVDGQPLGYQLLCEQPNRGFLEHNKIKTGGNMYKLLWYGRDLVGKHEKKSNVHGTYDDLIQLVDDLGKTKDDQQWQVIKKNFNVPEVINYFAVNTCLSHWDGFFNNYFTYHDTKGVGKWEMYPWDQDKTWGFHDSLGDDQIFWDMPITFGMEGDAPPGSTAGGRRIQGFNVGSWWRPPGVFSGPLLANPQFRKLYLARTREILETIYTPETFFPVIDNLGKRLEDEVRLRARIINEDPQVAVRRLATNLQLLKDHLIKRRDFLLKQDEIRTAGKWSEAALN